MTAEIAACPQCGLERTIHPDRSIGQTRCTNDGFLLVPKMEVPYKLRKAAKDRSKPLATAHRGPDPTLIEWTKEHGINLGQPGIEALKAERRVIECDCDRECDCG